MILSKLRSGLEESSTNKGHYTNIRAHNCSSVKIMYGLIAVSKMLEAAERDVLSTPLQLIRPKHPKKWPVQTLLSQTGTTLDGTIE